MADGAGFRDEKYSRLSCSAQNCGTSAVIESPVLSLMRKVHAELLTMREGRVAGYIAELEQVAPDQFGIALVTADGHLYEVGDTRSPFTKASELAPLSRRNPEIVVKLSIAVARALAERLRRTNVTIRSLTR